MPHPPETRHARLHRLLQERESELFELHRMLVAIPSVNWGDGASARETEVARSLADWLDDAGVSSRIVESAPGRGNLLARWAAPRRADRPGQSLLFMSHADVVPPGDASRWTHPPFSATRANGRIWGRGTNDCKMLVACQAFALACIARSGELGAGELRLAVGADEEAGGQFGFGWLARNEADFLRAALAVNEGGGAYVHRSADGRDLFLLGAGEKGRYEVVFSVEGPGTHASIPWGRPNPIVRIGELASTLSAWSSVPVTDSPVLGGFRSSVGLDGPPRLDNLGQTLDAARRISASFYNSLMAQTRVTIVPTVVRSGEKSNAVPASAELRCDARLLPGQKLQVLHDALTELMKPFPEVAWRIEPTAEPSVSPFTPGIGRLFEEATARALHPEGQLPGHLPLPGVLPTWCTGFTDSRFVRALGTPTYGYQLVVPEANPDLLGIHCVDESIDERMLLPCALSLAHLALDFCEARRGARGE